MAADDLDLDDWLNQKVSWMVRETSQYFDTRELLMLCQTVATMQLNQTLRELGQARAAEASKAPPAKKGAK